MNTYADDLAALVETLDLKSAIHVGHSTGGGEVARYIGRHGTKRVAKAVLIGAVPPLMLKTAANPGGLPIDVFNDIRSKVAGDRSQFYQDLSAPFYGANRPGSKVSQGLRDQFWRLSMQVGMPAVLSRARMARLDFHYRSTARALRATTALSCVFWYRSWQRFGDAWDVFSRRTSNRLPFNMSSCERFLPRSGTPCWFSIILAAFCTSAMEWLQILELRRRVTRRASLA